jgi:uncharacterized membrane protein YgcG
MEICFSAATQWPMNLALQFVVDGTPRGAPVDVTVGRSICKSQVSGSRQVIYYVRNPPLLRLARSFEARTVGYRLAGPTTLEWHLSTAPVPPAPAPAAKAPGRRKAGPAGAAGKGPRGGAGGASGAGGAGGAGDAGDAAAAAAAAAAVALQGQQLALMQQLTAAAGGCADPALQQQLAQWLAARAAGGADASPRRASRRKQPRPARAPLDGTQSGAAALWWPALGDGGARKRARLCSGGAPAVSCGA